MHINSFITLMGIVTMLSIVITAIKLGVNRLGLTIKVFSFIFTAFISISLTSFFLVLASNIKEVKTYSVDINTHIMYNDKRLDTRNLEYKTTKSKTYLEVATYRFYFLYDNKYTLYINNQ